MMNLVGDNSDLSGNISFIDVVFFYFRKSISDVDDLFIFV